MSAKSLKGQLLRGGSLKCDGAGGGHETKAPTTLSATLQQPEGMLMFTALKAADGAVTQQAMRMDTAAATAPASIMHLMSFYRERFGHRPGEFPVCERVAAQSLALPFFPAMTQAQVARVADALGSVLG